VAGSAIVGGVRPDVRTAAQAQSTFSTSMCTGQPSAPPTLDAPSTLPKDRYLKERVKASCSAMIEAPGAAARESFEVPAYAPSNLRRAPPLSNRPPGGRRPRHGARAPDVLRLGRPSRGSTRGPDYCDSRLRWGKPVPRSCRRPRRNFFPSVPGRELHGLPPAPPPHRRRVPALASPTAQQRSCPGHPHRLHEQLAELRDEGEYLRAKAGLGPGRKPTRSFPVSFF